jgi:hypothetical protein
VTVIVYEVLGICSGLVGARGCVFVKCVVWAGGLISRSRSLSGQLTFWPALAMREVGKSAVVG